MSNSMLNKYNSIEKKALNLMDDHGLAFLRIAMAVVFIWFGALKPFGLSPATQLVIDVTAWIPIPDFVSFLGYWEIAIGLCFLYQPLLRVALALLFLHMPGTMLPFFIVPEQCWTAFPYALTLEGQYIVKNLVLISGALVIGGALRQRMSELTRLSPSGLMLLLKHGQWGRIQAGEALVSQGIHAPGVYLLKSGKAQAYKDDKPMVELRMNQFVGETSFFTEQPAGITVRAMDDLEYIFWPADELKTLTNKKPYLKAAFRILPDLDMASEMG